MIQKRLFTLPVLFLASWSFAQSNPEVVAAELAFASAAKTQSIKAAFLKYMDSTAVVFDRGQAFNALEFWKKSEERSDKLLWHPAFFAMSASADLGFTTGPWEYRSSMKDSVAGSGHYTTVWTKNKDGEWKFVIDLGVSYRPTKLSEEQSLKNFSALTSAARPVDVIALENKFINYLKEKGPAGYADLLLEDTWLNTDRKHPIQTAALVLPELTAMPANAVFTPIAGGTSEARDMAYAYGTIQYEKKKENYLRIWVHTEKGWKILLQVIKR